MRRNNKKQRNSKKSQRGAHANDRTTKSASGSETNRRQLLARVRNWGVIGVLAAGVGWYMIDDVTATIAEHDLSRIGNGSPAIVQIHDPQCSRCRSLQRETRRALSTLDDGAIQYLVANIRTSKGSDFASSHLVSHVTLLLFDGNGKRRSIVRGNRDSKTLATIFRSHLEISAKK